MEPISDSPQLEGQYFHRDADPERYVPSTDILTLENIGTASDLGDADEVLEGDPDTKVDDGDDTPLEVCLLMCVCVCVCVCVLSADDYYSIRQSAYHYTSHLWFIGWTWRVSRAEQELSLESQI